MKKPAKFTPYYTYETEEGSFVVGLYTAEHTDTTGETPAGGERTKGSHFKEWARDFLDKLLPLKEDKSGLGKYEILCPPPLALLMTPYRLMTPYSKVELYKELHDPEYLEKMERYRREFMEREAKKAQPYEESAKLSGIPITREDIDAYLKSRWSRGDHLVYNLYHDGDKGAEDTVSVWVHCDPAKRFEKVEFAKALESNNPGLFHDVFIDDENGYWGWDDTLIKFKGSSGTNFTVSCYKIRRGDFYIYMHAGLHADDTPITADNFKELDAVIETFRYLNSVPPKTTNNVVE